MYCWPKGPRPGPERVEVNAPWDRTTFFSGEGKSWSHLIGLKEPKGSACSFPFSLEFHSPAALFSGMISCLWGDIGEHFIGEERKADRPAGAAVGTQVEPRASTSPSPTLPTYLMKSISCRRVDEATKEPYSHLADPRPLLISGKRESMMEPEYQGLIPQLCCLL